MTDEASFGCWDYQCQACDKWGLVNDMLLCEECDAKLQRDLIRGRDWDYVVAAFGLDDKGQERLRAEVVHRYGPNNELIVTPPKQQRSQRGQRQSKR
jgi:hypothetical protein